jgi:MYXO-CTERM domain-containing protein
MKHSIRWTLLCSLALVASPALAQDCPEGEGCEELPPLEPLGCDENLECAAPLACDSEADEPLCYYADQSCSSDEDCAPSFECVAGEDYNIGECVECADAPGEEEPVCTEVPCEPPPDQCFQQLIACEDDADCPEDWGCRELTLDYVAPHWADDVVGTLGCVPGGTLQLAEGNYYLGGYQGEDGKIYEAIPFSAEGGPADSGPAASGGGGDEPAETTAVPRSATDLGMGDEADDASAMSADSGCSVVAGSAPSSAPWLALAALALGVRRRSLRVR